MVNISGSFRLGIWWNVVVVGGRGTRSSAHASLHDHLAILELEVNSIFIFFLEILRVSSVAREIPRFPGGSASGARKQKYKTAGKKAKKNGMSEILW